MFIFAVCLAFSGHKVVCHKRINAGVVSAGAFRYVRHPLYLGGILFYLGLIVATASLFSLVVLAAIMLFYNYIAGYEERLLEARYGEEYRRYKERTGKWLPRIGCRGRMSRVIVMRPRFMGHSLPSNIREKMSI